MAPAHALASPERPHLHLATPRAVSARHFTANPSPSCHSLRKQSFTWLLHLISSLSSPSSLMLLLTFCAVPGAEAMPPSRLSPAHPLLGAGRFSSYCSLVPMARPPGCSTPAVTSPTRHFRRSSQSDPRWALLRLGSG